MTKYYLDVAYDERELAKRLGAKWDPSVRRWYCLAGSPLAKIFAWQAKPRANRAAASRSSLSPQAKMPPPPTPEFGDLFSYQGA